MQININKIPIRSIDYNHKAILRVVEPKQTDFQFRKVLYGTLTWRFMGSYKWSYKSPNTRYNYSCRAYNPTYNYP